MRKLNTLPLVFVVLLLVLFSAILWSWLDEDHTENAALGNASYVGVVRDMHDKNRRNELSKPDKNKKGKVNGFTKNELLDAARRVDVSSYEELIASVLESNIDGAAKAHIIGVASIVMGKSGNVNIAQAVITRVIGKGYMRTMAINHLYQDANIPFRELQDSINKWDDPEDRLTAATGVIHWARKQDHDRVQKALSEIGAGDSLMARYLVMGLSHKLSRIDDRVELLEGFRAAENDLAALARTDRDLLLKQFFVSVSSKLPFEAWSSWRSRIDTLPDGNDRALLMNAMHSADVERTLSMVMKDWPADPKNPHAVNDFLRKAVETGLKQDSAQVLKWYEANKATLSPEVSDGISEPIAKRLTMERKFDEAQKWVGQLNNEGIKERSIRGMAQFRTPEVREQVKKDPQATVEALQTENHLESPILIGVAVNEWLNKDPDAAGKWFFDNSKDMGPAERGHSAEAFVKYGIKVGDLDAARQWANQHSSEEKRREYHKQIDHAAVELKYKKDK